ncbi:MAG TPA: metalloregulator ArsR/SmtB family transcription factor [bacterium]|nr:metalloregulator ArsR/SmtB family transcription factor [bacterium]
MQEPIVKMIAGYFQALSHPTRIEILQLLKSKGEMCVCEIVEKLEKDQSNISRHLNALRTVGVVELRGEGVRSFYKVKHKDVDKILDIVKSILHAQVKEGQKVLEAF